MVCRPHTPSAGRTLSSLDFRGVSQGASRRSLKTRFSVQREDELADRARIAVGDAAVVPVEELERVLDPELVELARDRLGAEIQERLGSLLV